MRRGGRDKFRGHRSDATTGSDTLFKLIEMGVLDVIESVGQCLAQGQCLRRGGGNQW